MVTKSQINATMKYHKKTYDNLAIRYRKDEHIIEMIEKRAQELNKSKAQYIKDLILNDINNK